MSVSDALLAERIARALRRLGYSVERISDAGTFGDRLRRSVRDIDGQRPRMVLFDAPESVAELYTLIGELRTFDRSLPIVVILGEQGLHGYPRIGRIEATVLFARSSELELIQLAAQTLMRSY